MATTTWEIVDETNGDITDRVISARFTLGRQQYYDSYDGNSITIVVRNDDGAVNSFVAGSILRLKPNSSPNYTTFYLEAITFYDGLVDGEATATLMGIDIMSYVGRLWMQFSEGGGDGLSVLNDVFDGFFGGGVPGYYPQTNFSYDFFTITGVTIESISGNVSTLGDYVRKVIACQRQPYLYQWFSPTHSQNFLTPKAPTAFSSYGGPTITDAPTTTSLVWDECSRAGNGSQTFVTGAVSNQAGTTNYAGFYSFNGQLGRFTIDTLVASATDRASILNAYYLAWRTVGQTYEVVIHDFPQNTTAWNDFLENLNYLPVCFTTLQYRKASLGTESETVMMEGVEVEILPGVTRCTVYASSSQFHPFFVLDTEMGVLDTNRLGW
jgi:hypothetical protein